MESLVVAALVVAGSVLAAVCGLLLVRRRVPHRRLAAHTEVAGYVYAVILGLVVVAAWTEYEDARDAAEAEANALVDLVRLADPWPDAVRAPLRQAVRAYAETVIDDEWPAMARNDAPDPAAVAGMVGLWRAYADAERAGVGDDARFAASLAQLDAVDDARGLRILASRRGIPALMWVVLISGGILTVAFGYLFGFESAVAHGAMLAMLTALIALLLVLVQALNLPFRDPVGLPPDGLERVVRLDPGDPAAGLPAPPRSLGVGGVPV